MTDEEIKKLARVTNLEIDGDTYLRISEKINTIMKWCEDLEKIDTKDVEPMFSVFDVLNEYLPNINEDKVSVGDLREEILSNAPDKEDVFIAVPKVIEQ